MYKESLFDWATKNDKQNILKEWDYEKNNQIGLKIDNIGKSSKEKVWWLCPRGHSYQSQIVQRAQGSECPNCYKNQTSIPEQFLYFSFMQKFSEVENRKMLDNYEFDIFIKPLNLLIEYDGILYHKIKQNKRELEIDKENYAKEKGYRFIRVQEINEANKDGIIGNVVKFKFKGSEKRMMMLFSLVVDAILSNYGIHIDKTLPKGIYNEARQHSLKERKLKSIVYSHPDLLKEWDYEKNENLKPSYFSLGSEQKVWWICSKGHSYESMISNRTKQNTGCPYCAGNNKKKVYKYDKEGTLLNTYDSIGEAVRESKVWRVTHYAKSNQITQQGYIFSHKKLNYDFFKQNGSI